MANLSVGDITFDNAQQAKTYLEKTSGPQIAKDLAAVKGTKQQLTDLYNTVYKGQAPVTVQNTTDHLARNGNIDWNQGTTPATTKALADIKPSHDNTVAKAKAAPPIQYGTPTTYTPPTPVPYVNPYAGNTVPPADFGWIGKTGSPFKTPEDFVKLVESGKFTADQLNKLMTDNNISVSGVKEAFNAGSGGKYEITDANVQEFLKGVTTVGILDPDPDPDPDPGGGPGTAGDDPFVPSLGTVTPFTNVTPPPATDYVPPGVYKPPYADTVEGKLEGILSSGSPYMQAADLKGKEYANSRGLLNSTLAGEATQKAAIEAALPIASQDAQNIFDAALAGYQGEISGAKGVQDYGSQANLVNVQGGASSQLSAQDAAEASGLLAQEGNQGIALSKLQAEQAKEAAKQKAITDKAAAAQKAKDTQALSDSQEAAQTLRNNADIAAEEALKIFDLDSTEKVNLANQITTLGDTYQANVAAIQINPELSVVEKTKAIDSLGDIYQANLELVADFYEVEINWLVVDTVDDDDDDDDDPDDNAPGNNVDYGVPGGGP
ncbi:MAG: hypothetical protein H8D87_04830 [Deltaproteobacteria bacterium]|nr:hypothetical protein [Candidatus Desulfobacula maris]